MATKENPYLTITLTSARPVKILKADWPIVAEATERGWDGEHEFQSFRSTKAAIRVRQHADGRAIVYGSYHHESQYQGERGVEVRGGMLLDAGADIVAAIEEVAAGLADRIGDGHHGIDMVELGHGCVAHLPAVEV